MIEMYTCQSCGELKEEEDFETDFDFSITKDEMTCESCYDLIDQA